MSDGEILPTVSIVVPVRNGAATIGELLESLLKIDYDSHRLEIVVVDGNSTDKTRDIVTEYPVKLLTQEGEGLNAGRNTGIRHSNGEIIAFTDADCVVPENWITQIVQNFREPEVGCVGGNSEGWYNNFLSRYADNSVVPIQRIFSKRQKLDMIKLVSDSPAGSNTAFRREAIEKVGGFDEELRYGFDEVELVERVCRASYKMVLDPEVRVWHKHRSTLKALLKQNINFGRGGGILLKKKKARDVLSKWCLQSLIVFLAWVGIISSLLVLTFITELNIFLMLLLGVAILPLLGLVAFYTYRAVQDEKNRRYKRILIYALLDFLRAVAFCVGEIYELLKLEKQNRNLNECS
ncbi:MAG: glycosyltransferase [Candidatus Bathyarchaeia archaeon]